MSTQAEPGEISGSRGKAVLTPAARRGHAKVDDDGGEHASRAKRGGGGDAPAGRARRDQRVEGQSCADTGCPQQPRQGRRRRRGARKPSEARQRRRRTGKPSEDKPACRGESCAAAGCSQQPSHSRRRHDEHASRATRGVDGDERTGRVEHDEHAKRQSCADAGCTQKPRRSRRRRRRARKPSQVDRRVKGEAVPAPAACSSHARANGDGDERASRATRGGDNDEHANRAKPDPRVEKRR